MEGESPHGPGVMSKFELKKLLKQTAAKGPLIRMCQKHRCCLSSDSGRGFMAVEEEQFKKG